MYVFLCVSPFMWAVATRCHSDLMLRSFGWGQSGCRCARVREAQGCWRRSTSEVFSKCFEICSQSVYLLDAKQSFYQWFQKFGKIVHRSFLQLVLWIMVFAVTLWLTHRSVVDDKTVVNGIIAATIMDPSGWSIKYKQSVRCFLLILLSRINKKALV